MRTQRRQLGWRVLPLALLVGLAGCGSETLTGPSALEGGIWKLQTLQQGSSAVVPIAQPDRYTIEFRPDGTLAVKADCNNCSGTYTLSGATLTVGANMACTLVACPAASLDSAFLAVLSGAQTHGVKDDVLTITSTAGEMTLRR